MIGEPLIGDPVAGVRTTLAPEMAAPEGSATCPCRFPAGVCASEIAQDKKSQIAARYPNFLTFILNIPFPAKRYEFERQFLKIAAYCASPEGAPPKLHGVNIMACPAVGAACRIGSTPVSKVIAVAIDAAPSVATITTASPLCRSASVTAGMRFNSC